MDQNTYSSLTGLQLTKSQAARLGIVSELAKAVLEEMLGWPLDPADWENQYDEFGKSKNEYSCFSIDRDNLDEPDEVEGSYRLYPFDPKNLFHLIDPAITVHKVKIVNGDVTCHTFDPEQDYNLSGKNGNPRFNRWIRLRKMWWGCHCGYFEPHGLMMAVDADWAFPQSEEDTCVKSLPVVLQKVWAELIQGELDLKKDIKSESITSHSYTKFDRQTIEQKYGKLLQDYVGPLGTLKRPSVV